MVRALALAVVAAAACIPRPQDVPGGVMAPESITFGAFVGKSSGEKLVELINNGPGNTPVLGHATLVGEGADHFTVVRDDCGGLSIEIYHSCFVVLDFTATDVASRTAELHIDAAGDGPLVTKLVGGGAVPSSYQPRIDVNLPNVGAPFITDFNTDGKLDIALESGYVLLNTTTSATPSFSSTDLAVWIAGVVDADADGRTDLVRFDGGAVVRLNTTTSGAATPSIDASETSLLGPPSPEVITSADFNDDGLLDLAIGSRQAVELSVYLNQSTGPGVVAFAPRVIVAQNGIDSLAAADVSGDGKPDLAYTTMVSSVDFHVRVALDASTTTAAFPTVLELPTIAGYSTQAVRLGDINRDGRVDAVYMAIDQIWIALNEPDGANPSFRVAGKIPNGLTDLVTLADLNGDGALDIVTTQGLGLDVYFNATAQGGDTAIFAGPLTLPTGAGASRAAVADFTGDGKPEIVVGNSTSKFVSLYVPQ